MLQEIHASVAHPGRSASSPSGFAYAAAKISAIMRRGTFLIARIFDAIAEQRERQAKQIVAYYGHDRCMDSLEREIEDAGSEKEPDRR